MEIKLTDISSENLEKMFPPNQITSLIGPNGSGKTELINLICGVEKSISNSITNDVYYLKENYTNMLFNICIKEDIKFYLGNYDELNLYELLKSFNLNNKILDSNYLELSSSETRKILLIIGLMSNCKKVVIENPTLKLDRKSIQTLVKHLKKLKRKNKSIIISSYNQNFLLEVSDKILILNNKKIIEYGNKYDILSNEKILKKINISVPNVIKFANKVNELKKIRIGYRDNINDLIKDIFRYAK